jgi:hypothetical protein
MARARAAAARVEASLEPVIADAHDHSVVVLRLVRRASLALDRGRLEEAALLLGNAAVLARVASTTITGALERRTGAAFVIDAIDPSVQLP